MKKKTGFTLIELLVAITIGILVVGFGSVALNDFNEQQKVKAVKQELIANLRLARNYAITNQLGNNATKVVVSITSDGILTIKDYPTSKIFFDKDITPNGIIIGASTIYFSVNDGRSVTNATPLVGNTVTISVTGTDGVAENIKIDESGTIYEE